MNNLIRLSLLRQPFNTKKPVASATGFNNLLFNGNDVAVYRLTAVNNHHLNTGELA